MLKIVLQQVVGNSYYTTGIFAVGVYRYEDKVILIDSGSDEQSASRVADALQAENYIVRAIINTHCHPDHCGGNYFFQKKYPDVRVFAAHDEKMFIEDPKWAPRCFCGNAAPFSGLKNKHIAPQKPSVVTDTIPYQDLTLIIDDQKIKIVTLPGHTPGSIGIITQDNVLYSGDALFGASTLSKHPMLFYTDIAQTLSTFKKLKTMSVSACVLYHGGMIENLAEVAQVHEQRILETKDIILSMVQSKELSLDVLTQEVMQHYNITGSVISFTLTQTTVRAYLSMLEDENLIQVIVQDGLLQFKYKK
ncbi:MAG: MBL fold metallo-hydrolase [Candidatus Dependentiae bacterium]|nr:MBL fold metallo-hydrolase [Candidatus Dependentiae bacterium]